LFYDSEEGEYYGVDGQGNREKIEIKEKKESKLIPHGGKGGIGYEGQFKEPPKQTSRVYWDAQEEDQ